jgi:RimJ/RimL family protein N-acetyltransferase
MSPFGDAGTISAQRERIRSLLAPTDPVDAMTAYYALTHDPRRTHLSLHRTPAGSVDGFVAVCQTGRDLFVPLVVMRAEEDDVGPLLRRALRPGRPYTIITLVKLRRAIESVMVVEHWQINLIYVLRPDAYRPVLNVMVQQGGSTFRYEIRVRDQVAAAAGVNWQSGRLADVYIYTDPAFQGRGWGKAVGAACVRDLLAERLLPLYTVSEHNVVSQRLADALGFRDSGVRDFECRAVLRRAEG